MRFTGKLAAAAAIVGAVALMAPNSAYAATVGAGAVAVVGEGTIHPGLLPLDARNQAVSFTGQAAGVFVGADDDPSAGADAGVLSCTFGGSGTLETSLSGTGTVTGGCSGSGVLGPITVSGCAFTYTRVGPVVVTSGTCATATVSALPAGTVSGSVTVAGAFVFVPTSFEPTTTYVLVGATAGAGVQTP